MDAYCIIALKLYLIIKNWDIFGIVNSQTHLDNWSGFGRACTWDGSQNSSLHLTSIPKKLTSDVGANVTLNILVVMNFFVMMSVTLNFVVKKLIFFLRRKNSCWLWKEATWLPQEGWSFHLD